MVPVAVDTVINCFPLTNLQIFCVFAKVMKFLKGVMLCMVSDFLFVCTVCW